MGLMRGGISIQEWIQNHFRRNTWDEDEICDEWFRGHFSFAAETIQEWLGSQLKIEGSKLLDFGCGDGITALGVVLRGQPKHLLGVDITRAFSQLESLAQKQIKLASLPKQLEFRLVEPGKPPGSRSLDGVYSWSVLEHVDRQDLRPTAQILFETLRSGGIAFIQIEPLYYSAFGSHLQRVISQPWAHLLLEPDELERSVMSFEGELVESEQDLASRNGITPEFKRWLFDEYLGLNRLTGDELVQLFSSVGFEIIREHRGQRPEEPPPELCVRYNELDLKTNEIRLLLKKPT